eukprot:COSAG02_NODE_3404_length_6797_cov_54.443267_3_plen_100_part_00
MHTTATTLAPSMRKQAHMYNKPVIWPTDSGNVPERDVERELLPPHTINAMQPLRYRTNTHTHACMQTAATTPSTHKQAHNSRSPVMWLIDSGNVPERDV